jgi:hypothetical protein
MATTLTEAALDLLQVTKTLRQVKLVLAMQIRLRLNLVLPINI